MTRILPLHGISGNDQAHVTGDVSAPERVLGVVCDAASDRLSVTVPETPCPTDKRELLSTVASGQTLGSVGSGDASDHRWEDPFPAYLGRDAQLQAETGPKVWDPGGTQVHGGESRLRGDRARLTQMGHGIWAPIG